MTRSPLLTAKQCAIVPDRFTGHASGFVSFEHADGTITNHTLDQAKLLRDATLGVQPADAIGRALMDAAIEDMVAQRTRQRAARTGAPQGRPRRPALTWPPF